MLYARAFEFSDGGILIIVILLNDIIIINIMIYFTTFNNQGNLLLYVYTDRDQLPEGNIYFISMNNNAMF